MRLKLACGLAVMLVATLVLSNQGGSSASAESPRAKRFGNTDVIDLLRAGMDSSVIIAKIKQSPEVDFKLETDDLVALKKAGASPDIISAMLARVTPAADGPRAIPPLSGFGPGRTGTTILVTREGRRELDSSVGEFSTVGFAFVQMAFMNYPGLHASAKTEDRRPSLLIHSEFDPAEHYYIGKLDPDKKLNARSLKIKNRGNGFSVAAGARPDEDWMVPYDANEEEKGTWKLTPKSDLEPGEYGLFDGARLFGFGVGR